LVISIESYCQLVKTSDSQRKFTCNRLSVPVQLTDTKCKSSTVIKYFMFCGECNSDGCILFHLAVRTSIPLGFSWNYLDRKDDRLTSELKYACDVNVLQTK
jgi:hypothetical protein